VVLVFKTFLREKRLLFTAFESREYIQSWCKFEIKETKRDENISLCNLRVSYTVLASVMIHSTAILKLRCSSSITVSGHLGSSRRCVVRIPRRIILFFFLLYTYALYTAVPCDSHMILTHWRESEDCNGESTVNFRHWRMSSWRKFHW
jgi:hypothetical protein